MVSTADSTNKMKEAVRRIQEGASLCAISREYGIPKTTLHSKVHGKYPIVVNKTELTPEEENGLMSWIKGIAKRGFGCDQGIICDQVKKILDQQKRQTRFKENRPGKDWYYGFLKRHPDLSSRTLFQLSKQRALLAPGMVRNWFNDFSNFMEDQNVDDAIWSEPERWFNADETGFPLSPKSNKIVSEKGSSNVYHFTPSEKNVITVMACICASGDFVPPMIVFAGTRFNYSPLEGFPDAAFGRSVNGWMDVELFNSWLKDVFKKYIDDKNIKRPVVLFVDGHRTHFSMEALEICFRNGIILYCLLENASHVIQPCDMRLFSSLKNSWRKSVWEFQDQNPGEVVTKQTFSRVFKRAWEESAKPEIASGSFRDTGIFPFNPDKVFDSSRLKPCQLFQQQHANLAPVNETISAAVNPQVAQTLPTSMDESPSNRFDFRVPTPVKKEPADHHLLSALDLATMGPRRKNCSCPCTCGAERPLPLSTNPQEVIYHEASTSAPISTSSLASQIISQAPFPTSQISPQLPSVNLTPSTSSAPSPFASFINIPLPQVFITPKKKRGEDCKLLKTATGEASTKILQDKQKKMDEEQRAKEDISKNRVEKKRKVEKEKQRKREEREEKNKKRRKQELIRQITPEMENSNDNISVIDLKKCHKCDGVFVAEQAASWIGCNRCPRWFHIACVDIDLTGMSADDVQAYFECLYC